MQKIDERRRITVDRRAFNHYEVPCPFCGENVGPRFVTREHLDIPPNPPYAATVRCPRCKEEFEVVFSSGRRLDAPADAPRTEEPQSVAARPRGSLRPGT